MAQKDILTEVSKNASFDFSSFQAQAIARLKAGQPLMGESRILTPLIKHIIEALLNTEMDEDMEQCGSNNIRNRRNGTSKNMLQTASGPHVNWKQREIGLVLWSLNWLKNVKPFSMSTSITRCLIRLLA